MTKDYEFKCCICSENDDGWGNSPEPFKPTMRDGMILTDNRDQPILCCDSCFHNFVKPARDKTLDGLDVIKRLNDA